MKALVSRVHGGPVEKVETSDVSQVDGLPLDELRRLRQTLLDRHPELARLRTVE